MDAMSDAIEGADVMLYGVSLRYKESANVSRIAVRMPAMHGCESLGLVRKRLTHCAYVLLSGHSVEWCALDVLPNLDLPNCPTAQHAGRH